MNLLQDYRDILEKIKNHITAELKKRYDYIKFDDCNIVLLGFNIREYGFYIHFEKTGFCVGYCKSNVCNNNSKYIETFNELFKYIDDVIKNEQSI